MNRAPTSSKTFSLSSALDQSGPEGLGAAVAMGSTMLDSFSTRASEMCTSAKPNGPLKAGWSRDELIQTMKFVTIEDPQKNVQTHKGLLMDVSSGTNKDANSPRSDDPKFTRCSTTSKSTESSSWDNALGTWDWFHDRERIPKLCAGSPFSAKTCKSGRESNDDNLGTEIKGSTTRYQVPTKGLETNNVENDREPTDPSGDGNETRENGMDDMAVFHHAKELSRFGSPQNCSLSELRKNSLIPAICSTNSSWESDSLEEIVAFEVPIHSVVSNTELEAPTDFPTQKARTFSAPRSCKAGLVEPPLGANSEKGPLRGSPQLLFSKSRSVPSRVPSRSLPCEVDDLTMTQPSPTLSSYQKSKREAEAGKTCLVLSTSQPSAQFVSSNRMVDNTSSGVVPKTMVKNKVRKLFPRRESRPKNDPPKRNGLRRWLFFGRRGKTASAKKNQDHSHISQASGRWSKLTESQRVEGLKEFPQAEDSFSTLPQEPTKQNDMAAHDDSQTPEMDVVEALSKIEQNVSTLSVTSVMDSSSEEDDILS